MSWYIKNIWYTVLMSHIHVTSRHKYMIFSTHVTQSYHVISQMSDIQYSYHTVMSCHKCLIFSTNVTQTCKVLSHISDIKFSYHTVMLCYVTNAWYPVIMSHKHVMSCHKYLIFILMHKVMSCHKWLIFITHDTQSWYVTNYWYSVLIIHRHVMSCFVTKPWYLVLMLHSHVGPKMSDIQNTRHGVMSCHKCMTFNTHVIQSCHVTNIWY